MRSLFNKAKQVIFKLFKMMKSKTFPSKSPHKNLQRSFHVPIAVKWSNKIPSLFAIPVNKLITAKNARENTILSILWLWLKIVTNFKI